MKKAIKIYLEPEDEKSLKQKAEALFPGRGSVSLYISKIASEPVAFLDSNVKAVLSALNLVPN